MSEPWWVIQGARTEHHGAAIVQALFARKGCVTRNEVLMRSHSVCNQACSIFASDVSVHQPYLVGVMVQLSAL